MRRVLLPLLALLVLGACTDKGSPTPDGSLPPVAVDDCPTSVVTRPPTQPGPAGKLMPSLTLDCLAQGPAVTLNLLGRPYLINLWASWCAPCAAEMPVLQRIYRDLGDRMGMLGVDMDDFPKPARETIQATAVTYPSVVDKESKLRLALLRIGVPMPGPPVTLLVRPDGVIPDGGVLIGEQSEAELRAAIGQVLGVTS